MGMAASQGRLLSLTGSLSDLELRSQRLTNSKVILANESEVASKAYTDALNKQKLQMNTYVNGVYQAVDVTTDILHDNGYRVAFKNGNGDTIPAINGNSMPKMPTFAYSGSPAISGIYTNASKIGQVSTFPSDYDETRMMPTSTPPTYKSTYTTEPDKVTLEGAANIDMADNPDQATEEIKNHVARFNTTWRTFKHMDAYNNSGLKKLVDSGQIQLLTSEWGAIGFQLGGELATQAKEFDLPTVYSSLLDLITALIGKDEALKYYCGFNQGASEGDFVGDLCNFSSDDDPEGAIPLGKANGALGALFDINPDCFNLAFGIPPNNENNSFVMGQGALTKQYLINYEEEGDPEKGTNDYFMQYYRHLQINYELLMKAYNDYCDYKDWMSYYVTCVFDEYNEFLTKDMDAYDQDLLDWQTQYCSGLSEEEIKEGTEVFNNLQSKGAAYLSALFQYGNDQYFIQKYENGAWVDKSLNQTNIQVVHDSGGDAIAEAKYNSAIAKIKVKENQIDRELKKIETEHSAAEAEYDSVKSVIEKNMENSLKLFG